MRAARPALPWYVHPAEAPREWTWLAAQQVSFAVINIRNGPGPDGDPYYPVAVNRLAGTRLLGYVPVGYGRREVAEVAEDIRRWQGLYRLQGIMLDELPATRQGLARSAQYAAAARCAGIRFLAANPGVFPTEEHLRLFDVTSVFEGTARSYRDFRHPAWAREVPPARLWHLVHSCDPAQIGSVARTAAERGAGYVFATDRTPPNPWLGPPTGVSADLAAGRRPVCR